MLFRITLHYSGGRRIPATTESRPTRGDTGLWVKIGKLDRFVNLSNSSLEAIDFEAGRPVGSPEPEIEIRRIEPR